MRKLLLTYILLTLVGPAYIFFSKQIDFSLDWRTADRSTAQISPLPNEHPEAIIQAYAARTFHWRGLFSVHTWIAVKPKNAKQYTVYDAVGWRHFMGQPTVIASNDIPDRKWFAQAPKIFLDIRGSDAAKLIPAIENAVKAYPYKNDYQYWPGPNSNTFIAYIGRSVPALKLTLPANAIGKDFLVKDYFISQTPSGTGYQLSILGLLGLTLAQKEGFEINLLGLSYGINWEQKSIILPGIGNFKL